MDKRSINFNKLLKTFRDKWVAVSDDYSKVFASGSTLESIVNKFKNKVDVKMFKVIPFDISYSP